MGKKHYSERNRLTNQSHRRVRIAAACAATAMLATPGQKKAGAATVPSDNQYNITTTTNFSAVLPAAGDSSGELNFSGTTYTVTDDLTASINNLTFNSSGLITVAGSNTLTLNTSSGGFSPSIVVGAGGATISDVLAGTNGFNLSGGGVLTLGTNADTVTGNVTVNNSTLTLNIGQAASTAFYLNSGTLNLSGTTPLAGTNAIYAASGTSSFSTADATLNALFYGNGTLNWNTTVAQTGVSYAGNSSIFANFGGSINWGSNSNGIRIISSTSSTTSWNPFANFNLGSGSAGLNVRNGTADIVLGGLASTSATAGIYGAGSSGGHDSLWIVGSANIASETFAGGIFASGQAPNAFLKTGSGLLALTGVSTSIDTAGTAGAAYQTPGTYNVYGGTLQLNFATNASNLLPATTAFGMAQGGVLSLLGNGTSNSSQTFAGLGTTVGTGGGGIVMNADGAARTMTLNLGAITATAAGSVLNISTTGSGTDVVSTTNAVLADGTYGARLTYGTGFATTSGSSPYTLSTYTPGATFSGADVATTDYLLTGSGTVTAADSVNSLTVSSATGSAQSLSLGAKLTLTNGGFLYNGSDAYSVTGTGPVASTATDLIVQQLGTGKLTINAPVASSGAGTLTKGGSGTLVLGGANTYTGQTYLDGGVTSISSNANLGAPATGATVNLEGGTLQASATFGLFNGSPNVNNRAVVIGGSGGTIDVTGSNTLTVAGVVSDTSIGTNTTSLYGPLTKTDSGTLVLSGTNTYAGATIINGGTLSVSNLALGNVASGIGQAPSTANALVINGATLQYTGTGGTTDRDFTLGQNGATIDVTNATGSVMAFSNLLPIATAGSGARTLTLTSSLGADGSPSGLGGSLALAVVDGTGGSTNLAVSGTKWTLSNPANTYTGTTTISNGGTLALAAASSNSIAASSTINVGVATGTTAKLDVSGLTAGTIVLSPAQTLTGTGTVAGSVNVGATSILAPGSASTSVGTLAITGNLTLGAGSISDFEFNGNTPVTNDQVNVAGALNLNAADGINLYAPGGTTKFTTPGTYNLFGFGTQTGGTPQADFSVLNPAAGLTYTFSDVGSEVQLNISGASIVSSTWNNSSGGNYNTATNWNPQTVPNAIGATAIFGSVITAPQTVTVDAADTVGEIDFNNVNAYTLQPDAGNDPITLNNSPTTGVFNAAVLNDISGSHTVNVPLVVTGQAPSNTNPGLAVTVATAGSVLTLSGAISEANGAATLTKVGPGTLALLGTNTYTGGTLINAGVVQINGPSALGATSGVAALNSSSASVTLEALNSITTARNFTLDGTNNSFQVDGATAVYEIDGVISDAASTSGNTLAKTGAGTLALVGTNTYSGNTTISAGTLALGNGTTVGGSVAGNIVDGAALSLNRPFGDDYSLGNAISGTGTLTQAGGDNVTLTAANTFSGNTIVSGVGGSLVLGNPLALEDSTLYYNNQGGTFSFGTLTTATLGGLSGAQPLDLDNATPAAVALTVGNNGQAASYAGNLTGAGSLTKVGGGAQTLAGANTYAGTTSANGGTLVLTGSLGSATTAAAAVTVNPGGALNVSGGSLYATSLSAPQQSSSTSAGLIILANGGTMNTGSGALSLNAASSQGSQTSTAELLSGTATFGSVLMGRTTYNLGSAIVASTAANTELYVNGATVTINATLGIGTAAGTLSSAIFHEDGGSVTVNGTTTIADDNNRVSVMDVAGGTFTSNDTLGAGIQIGGTFANSYAELLVRGGTVNTNAVTLGDSAGIQTSGVNTLELLGGTINVGAGGIVIATPSANTGVTNTANIGGTAYATAPTIGALASWTSSVGMTLTNSSSGVAPIFNPNGNTITLTGGIGGATGGLNLDGPGTLALLSTGNFYGGVTTLTAGTLQINGLYALGGANYGGVTFNGGTLQYVANLPNTYGGGDISTPLNAAVVTIAAGGGTIDTNGNNVTFGSSIGNGGTGALTKVGAGALTLGGANTYTGGTFVNGGTLLANTPGASTSSTGTGRVVVNSGGTLGGNGVIGNTAGPVTINGTGIITAGATSLNADTLTTNAQAWNSSAGQYVAKVFDASNTSTGSTTAGNDRLVMSALTITSGFSVDVNVSSGTLTTLQTSPAAILVLANDKDTTGVNPFNTGGAAPAGLSLQINGDGNTTATDQGLSLATQSDSLGNGGWDLILEDSTAATPEPTSILLAGVAAAPLLLGRRRRKVAAV